MPWPKSPPPSCSAGGPFCPAAWQGRRMWHRGPSVEARPVAMGPMHPWCAWCACVADGALDEVLPCTLCSAVGLGALHAAEARAVPARLLRRNAFLRRSLHRNAFLRPGMCNTPVASCISSSPATLCPLSRLCMSMSPESIPPDCCSSTSRLCACVSKRGHAPGVAIPPVYFRGS